MAVLTSTGRDPNTRARGPASDGTTDHHSSTEEAFIGVGISHPKYFEQFGKRVLALPDVLECHRVAGSESYLLKIRTENTRSLDRLLVEQLRTIPGVFRTETTLVLSSIKEDMALSINVEQESSS